MTPESGDARVELKGTMLYVSIRETRPDKCEAGMNVKVSIELPERVLEFAEGMVRDGAYGSLSEIFEEHLRYKMLERSDDEPTQEQMDSVTAMADEIRRRMRTPKDQWLSEQEFDKEMQKLYAHADEQIKAGR